MPFLLGGIFAALFALVLELTLGLIPGFEYSESRTHLNGSLVFTSLTFSLFASIEEVMKFLVLRKISSGRFEKIFPLGAVLFSVGFAGTEVALATSKFPDAPGVALIGIFFVHLATMLLYGLALQKRLSGPILVASVLVGIALHTLYNLSLR